MTSPARREESAGDADRPDRPTMAAAVELACRAPSLHNSQPWRWRLDEHTVHLYADESRLLHVADPSGRELVMSCGAALHHSRVAFASMGWRTFVHRLPNPAQPSHLAALEFVRFVDVPPYAVTQARAIEQRCTDRRPYLPEPVPTAVLDRLTAAANAEHATLTVADTLTARREVVVAMTTANAEQRNDPAYRTELATWAARGFGAVDGVPVSSLRAPDPLARPLLARDFSSAGPGELASAPMDDGALLAVLSTRGDDRRSWLTAGEALSAMVLTATAAGLASCPLSQVVESDLARETVQSAVLGGRGQPQLLVRLGWPPNRTSPMPRSPRRPCAEVIAETA